MEFGVGIVFFGLGGLVFYDALRLGPGWGPSGPQPGFFLFILDIALFAGALGVMAVNVTKPDRRPFFEVSREVVDLLKVGMPIAIAVLAIRWAGLYVTSGVYLAFFMLWYGRFRWYQALAGGILLPLAMWMTLREGFNIAMPMTVFYHKGILPF
ncbi:MAG: tripartite tricarboxylate transporter TctB family protein [Desulfuromonadales bacterium]|nr:tripartite tricarboxylate transporter TctB family protein [Desulfuromonadales bacterium]NIS40100.1 tripartite tricarboxylate transporter TctB family protein [Desulfuromonadales bacterium]